MRLRTRSHKCTPSHGVRWKICRVAGAYERLRAWQRCQRQRRCHLRINLALRNARSGRQQKRHWPHSATTSPSALIARELPSPPQQGQDHQKRMTLLN